MAPERRLAAILSADVVGYTVPVEVEKYTGNELRVTAFDAPEARSHLIRSASTGYDRCLE